MAVSMRSKSKRQKKEEVYKSFVWQKSLSGRKTNLKSSFELARESLLFFRRHYKHFSLLAALFLGLAFVFFLSAESAIDLKQMQVDLRMRYGDNWSAEISNTLILLPELIDLLGWHLARSLGWFVILNLLISLTLWWLIRNLRDAKRRKAIHVRDALYFGPAQIIPFTILVVILFVQLLPALIIADFGAQLRINQVLQTNWEQLAVVLVIIAVFALSFYWIVGGAFSLIIASLPGVKPFSAWQTSLNLTHRQRWPIALRLFFLVLVSVFGICLLVLPFLWLLPQWADYLLYLIGLMALIISHIYCFLLYQDLLADKIEERK